MTNKFSAVPERSSTLGSGPDLLVQVHRIAANTLPGT
jgi:hypothetical protein